MATAIGIGWTVEVAKLYEEACKVIGISPAGSAVLARRAMQLLLTFLGYKGALNRQIDRAYPAFRSQPAMPDLGLYADHIRIKGNLSAHPAHLNSRRQPIEITHELANWSLEMLELLLDLSYETPLRYEQRLAEFECRLVEHKKPGNSTH